MSKSILGVALTITGLALMAIPGVGQALGLGALSIAGTSIGVGAIIGLGMEVAGSLLLGPSVPKSSAMTQTALSRLYATLVPTEPRKIVFGDTASSCEVRFH